MPSPPIPIWTEVVCLQCAHTGHGQFTRYARNRTQLRKDVLADGWLLKHGDIFCSPKCLADYEVNNGH